MVTPDEPQYAAVMRGENVPPEPVNAKPRKAEADRHRAGLGDPGSLRRRPARRRGPPAAPAASSGANDAPAPAPTGAPAWLKG